MVFLMEFFEFNPEFFAQLQIKIAEGLIEEIQAGLSNERPGQSHSLGFTAAEGARRSVQQMFDVKILAERAHPFIDFGLIDLHQLRPEGKGDIVIHIVDVEEVIAFKYK